MPVVFIIIDYAIPVAVTRLEARANKKIYLAAEVVNAHVLHLLLAVRTVLRLRDFQRFGVACNLGL